MEVRYIFGAYPLLTERGTIPPRGRIFATACDMSGATQREERQKRHRQREKPTIIYHHAQHTARGRRSAQEPPTASGGPANHAQQESRHEARQGRTAPPTCLPSPDCTGGPEAIRSPATLDTIHRHGGRHHRPQEATTPTPDRWTSTAPTTRNANRGPHHTYITFYYTYIKKNIA